MTEHKSLAQMCIEVCQRPVTDETRARIEKHLKTKGAKLVESFDKPKEGKP